MPVGEMPCPRCSRKYECGDCVPRPELAKKPLGPMLKSGVRAGTPYTPNDVVCECGAILRVVVPIFKVSEAGWYWEII